MSSGERVNDGDSFDQWLAKVAETSAQNPNKSDWMSQNSTAMLAQVAKKLIDNDRQNEELRALKERGPDWLGAFAEALSSNEEGLPIEERLALWGGSTGQAEWADRAAAVVKRISTLNEATWVLIRADGRDAIGQVSRDTLLRPQFSHIDGQSEASLWATASHVEFDEEKWNYRDKYSLPVDDGILFDGEIFEDFWSRADAISANEQQFDVDSYSDGDPPRREPFLGELQALNDRRAFIEETFASKRDISVPGWLTEIFDAVAIREFRKVGEQGCARHLHKQDLNLLIEVAERVDDERDQEEVLAVVDTLLAGKHLSIKRDHQHFIELGKVIDMIQHSNQGRPRAARDIDQSGDQTSLRDWQMQQIYDMRHLNLAVDRQSQLNLAQSKGTEPVAQGYTPFSAQRHRH